MLLILSLVAALPILLTSAQSPQQCGKGNIEQLLNRQKTLDDHEYPWIGIVRSETDSALCIAVLITRRHTLFPAHCATDEINWIQFNDSYGNRVFYALEEVAVHPDYALLRHSDIAVGRLKNEVANVQPICMPPAKEHQVFGQRLEVAGVPFEKANIRIKGQAHIGTPEFCSKQLKDLGSLSPNHICGYLSDNLVSGSALMSVNVAENNPSSMELHLIGILVFGKRRGNSFTGDYVLLLIHPYRDWIARNTIE